MLHIPLTELPEGRQLKLARVAAGLTIWEVARRAGVHPARLSEHERGSGQLSPDALTRVHQVLAEQLADVKTEVRRVAS